MSDLIAGYDAEIARLEALDAEHGISTPRLGLLRWRRELLAAKYEEAEPADDDKPAMQGRDDLAPAASPAE